MTDTTPSRARARKSTWQEVELRKREICVVMRDNKWHGESTALEFADKWGLSLQTIYGYSAECSRQVRAEVNDPELVSATIGSVMRGIVTDEFADNRDKIGAAAQWSKLAIGVIAPTKLEVSAVDSEHARLEALAPAERATELRAMAARLIEAANELEAGE